MTTITRAPLLAVGTLGIHAVETGGIWSFAGEVPRDIRRGGYPTEQAAIEALAQWFTAQSNAFVEEYITKLRDDVVAALFYPLGAE